MLSDATDEVLREGWLEHRVPPPLVAVCVAFAMWLASAWGSAFALPAPARRIGIAALVSVAITVDVLGLLAFHMAHTTVNPMQPGRASTLVTSGIYRVTRNPMYVGLALLLTAWALHLSAWLPWAGPIVFVAYVTRFQIRSEERALARRFPVEYAQYAARVRRWL